MLEYDAIEEKVNVTKTDIKKGKKSADTCPIARALNRTLRIYGARVVIDSMGYACVWSRRGSGKHEFGSIDLPDCIEVFRNKFWRDEKVEPFSFMINFVVIIRPAEESSV